MNLSTTYLGLKLRTPLVPSASPLSESLDNIKRMEDAGASAIVLHSLFEEQLRQESHTLHYHLTHGTESYPESLTYFPEPEEFRFGPDLYLGNIVKAKEAVDLPIIASLNASTFGGWITFARKIEQAGADALELNIYSIPTDPELSSEEIETSYLTILTSVRSQVKIPIAVKLSPFFTNFARFARQLDTQGADGLVLFNRFYAPDIDLSTLRVTRSLPLSTAAELPLSLVWIALLSRRLACSLGASRGVETDVEVVKYLLVGADAVMTTSALMRHGPEHLATMREGLERWLGANGFDSVDAIRGLKDATHVEDFDALFRAQYVASLTEYMPGKLV
jgi:dihydroorotate dehydrogenase (fumarate)